MIWAVVVLYALGVFGYLDFLGAYLPPDLPRRRKSVFVGSILWPWLAVCGAWAVLRDGVE